MMKFYKWLNKEKARYYTISVQKNAKNNIILNYRWGSCITNRGGKKSISVQSAEEVQGYINQMIKRRKSRGYELQIAS